MSGAAAPGDPGRLAGAVDGCTFCGIVRGDVPAHVVFDDGAATDDAATGRAEPADGGYAAFLDVRPLFKGHVLLVPRVHVETLTDLPVGQVGPLFERAQRLAAAMESVLGAAGSFVALNNRISQSVPHLHVHVVPRNRKDGLRGFFWPRTTYDDDIEAAAYAARLRAGLARPA